MRNEKLVFRNLIIVLSFLFLTSHLLARQSFGEGGSPLTSALATSSPNYNLEIRDIDTSPDADKKTPKALIEEVIQSAPKNSEEKIGIQTISQTSPLSFSISTQLVDFGTLSPGNPVTRSADISVLSTSIDYTIMAFEDHPPSLSKLSGTNPQSGETIPNTTCDNGSCTKTEASSWNSSLTYGFGFRCDAAGEIFCLMASDENYYSQFADFSKSELPQAIIAGHKNDQEQQAQASLKLNTSSMQKSGNYSNTVTFIAVPNF
jgi:hypothetical protein